MRTCRGWRGPARAGPPLGKPGRREYAATQRSSARPACRPAECFSLLLRCTCRDRRDASQRELKRSVKLLFAAAGIQHLSMERPAAKAAKPGSQAGADGSASGASRGSGKAGGSAGGPEFQTAAAVRLELRADRAPLLAPLKELVFAYREGACDAVCVRAACGLSSLLACCLAA